MTQDFTDLVYHQDQRESRRFFITTPVPKIYVGEATSESYAKLFAVAPRMIEALIGLTYGIKTCGHNFTCICNQVKAESVIAEIEGEKYRNAWQLEKENENS